MKLTLIIVMVFMFAAGVSAQSVEQDFEKSTKILAGEWKLDGKEVYESWRTDGGSFVGKGFRIRDNVESVTETLEVKVIDGAVYYLATVPNQNNGAAVRFKLSSVTDDSVVFENPDHDFPKKIVYRRSGADALVAEVTGAGGKGFTLKFGRRPAPTKED